MCARKRFSAKSKDMNPNNLGGTLLKAITQVSCGVIRFLGEINFRHLQFKKLILCKSSSHIRRSKNAPKSLLANYKFRLNKRGLRPLSK